MAEPGDKLASRSANVGANPGASPTLDDVARLTPDSDYTAFTAPGVDPQVRNEALRKLFHSDPHFQRHDGLEVALDEQIEVGQSPLARQRKILQARALGLLDDDLLDQADDDAVAPAPSHGGSKSGA